jgi:hypothetical protein
LKDNIVQVADFDQRDRLVIPREGVERWAAKLREALTFMSV